MTPEAQRIAIAEVCGWRQHPFNKTFGSLGGKGEESVVWPSGLPRYLSDLNAMHEAEKSLTAEQRRGYGEHLTKVVASPHGYGFHLYTKYPWAGDDVMSLAHATAAQRAEAFLRTLNLWDDSK